MVKGRIDTARVLLLISLEILIGTLSRYSRTSRESLSIFYFSRSGKYERSTRSRDNHGHGPVPPLKTGRMPPSGLFLVVEAWHYSPIYPSVQAA